MKGIAAVIFDVGNVLFHWDPRILYERLIEDDRALDAFLRDVVTHDWHFQHDAGRCFADTSAELIALHPDKADLIRVWGERFLDSIGPVVAGMPDLVRDLHDAGVPLYGLTNFSAEFWPPFRAREADFFAPFADVLVSGEERIVKPDPAIYRLALDRFGLEAERTLFVDDRAENVAGALAVRMQALLFTDAAALRRDLVAMGLIAG